MRCEEMTSRNREAYHNTLERDDEVIDEEVDADIT
jgi:hypothetical protein